MTGAPMESSTVDVRAQFYAPPNPDGIIGFNHGSRVPADQIVSVAQRLRERSGDLHPNYGLAIIVTSGRTERVLWRRVGPQLTLFGEDDT
jgi:hypothetical protein